MLRATVFILACQTAKAEDPLGSYNTSAGSAHTRQLATLANEDILESSGLAISIRTPQLFWTHNDSGDRARLFAFDADGRHRGVVSLADVIATDWEDIASFRRNDGGWLLVADVGDNGQRRETCVLHLLPEPDPRTLVASVHSSITFRYEGGPIDCESVGIDVTSNLVLLASKSVFGSRVYALLLPTTPMGQISVAQLIATIPVPLATALDISPDGRRAIVLTYTDAYEFQRDEDESWAAAFKRPPVVISMPIRRQGESVCYGPDGRSLFLTSERTPTPLWFVERSP